MPPKSQSAQGKSPSKGVQYKVRLTESLRPRFAALFYALRKERDKDAAFETLKAQIGTEKEFCTSKDSDGLDILGLLRAWSGTEQLKKYGTFENIAGGFKTFNNVLWTLYLHAIRPSTRPYTSPPAAPPTPRFVPLPSSAYASTAAPVNIPFLPPKWKAGDSETFEKALTKRDDELWPQLEQEKLALVVEKLKQLPHVAALDEKRVKQEVEAFMSFASRGKLPGVVVKMQGRRLLVPQLFSVATYVALFSKLYKLLPASTSLLPSAVRPVLLSAGDSLPQVARALFGTSARLGGQQEVIYAQSVEFKVSQIRRLLADAPDPWLRDLLKRALKQARDDGLGENNYKAIDLYGGLTRAINQRVSNGKHGGRMREVMHVAELDGKTAAKRDKLDETSNDPMLSLATLQTSTSGSSRSMQVPLIEADTNVASTEGASFETWMIFILGGSLNTAAGGRIPLDDPVGPAIREIVSQQAWRVGADGLVVIHFSPPPSSFKEDLEDYGSVQLPGLQHVWDLAFSPVDPTDDTRVLAPEIIDMAAAHESSEKPLINGANLGMTFEDFEKQHLPSFIDAVHAADDANQGCTVLLVSPAVFFGLFDPLVDSNVASVRRGHPASLVEVGSRSLLAVPFYEANALRKMKAKARNAATKINALTAAVHAGLVTFLRSNGCTLATTSFEKQQLAETFCTTLPDGLGEYILHLATELKSNWSRWNKLDERNQRAPTISAFPSAPITVCQGNQQQNPHKTFRIEDVQLPDGRVISETVSVTFPFFNRERRTDDGPGDKWVKMFKGTTVWSLELVGLSKTKYGYRLLEIGDDFEVIDASAEEVALFRSCLGGLMRKEQGLVIQSTGNRIAPVHSVVMQATKPLAVVRDESCAEEPMTQPREIKIPNTQQLLKDLRAIARRADPRPHSRLDFALGVYGPPITRSPPTPAAAPAPRPVVGHSTAASSSSSNSWDHAAGGTIGSTTGYGGYRSSLKARREALEDLDFHQALLLSIRDSNESLREEIRALETRMQSAMEL